MDYYRRNPEIAQEMKLRLLRQPQNRSIVLRSQKDLNTLKRLEIGLWLIDGIGVVFFEGTTIIKYYLEKDRSNDK